MSVKDTRFYRDCPICGDKLVGTDDGLGVYLGLVDALDQKKAGRETFEDTDEPITFGCGLCGDQIEQAEAEAIVARGEPPMQNNTEDEDD